MRKWTLQSRKGCNRWFQIKPIPAIPDEPEKVVVVAIDDVIERLEIAINSPNAFIRTARIDQLVSDLKASQ